jgi:hypothetical protein
MLIGTFHKYVQQCNPKLRFLSSSDESKPIGLYYIDDFKIEHVCGTDRFCTPEFIEFDSVGHIVKSGWRRTIDILISKKYVSADKASAIFGSCFSKDCKHLNTRFKPELDPVGRAIRDASKETTKVMIEGEAVDSVPMKRDDIMDISSMINKKKEKENAA